MPRITDDNKYMDNAMEERGAGEVAVTTDEEQDQTGYAIAMVVLGCQVGSCLAAAALQAKQ